VEYTRAILAADHFTTVMTPEAIPVVVPFVRYSKPSKENKNAISIINDNNKYWITTFRYK